MSEFVFLEWRPGEGIWLDVGPFREDPTDEETEHAFQTLQSAAFGWLNLTGESWTLDLDGLAATAIPGLTLPGSATGLLRHAPAFEWAMSHDSLDKRFFLRISFPLTLKSPSTSDPQPSTGGTRRAPNGPISCPACKAQNLPDSTFCDQCGVSLQEAAEAGLDAVEAATDPSHPTPPTPWSPEAESGDWAGKDTALFLLILCLSLLFAWGLFH